MNCRKSSVQKLAIQRFRNGLKSLEGYLPCLVEPAIALGKEVLGVYEEGALNAGADVRYKFTITDEGPLYCIWFMK